MSTDWLNLNQTPDELRELYGEQDYYYYLRSPEFCRAFIEPISQIVNTLGLAVLDVGCGEGCLVDYTLLRKLSYLGIDGSETAIERARTRRPDLQFNFVVDRFEEPTVIGVYPTLVLSGILEVLIRPEHRTSLIRHYRNRFGTEYMVICDLERLDETLLRAEFGKPLVESHLVADSLPERDVEEVKRRRKLLVFKC